MTLIQPIETALLELIPQIFLKVFTKMHIPQRIRRQSLSYFVGSFTVCMILLLFWGHGKLIDDDVFRDPMYNRSFLNRARDVAVE